jgi:hypothetical protein
MPEQKENKNLHLGSNLLNKTFEEKSYLHLNVGLLPAALFRIKLNEGIRFTNLKFFSH